MISTKKMSAQEMVDKEIKGYFYINAGWGIIIALTLILGGALVQNSLRGGQGPVSEIAP